MSLSALWWRGSSLTHSFGQSLLDDRVQFIASLNAGPNPSCQSLFCHFSIWLQPRNLVQAGEERHSQTALVLAADWAVFLCVSRVNHVRCTILADGTTKHQIIHFDPCICQSERSTCDGVGQNRSAVLKNHHVDLDLGAGIFVEAHSWLQTLMKHQGEVFVLASLDPGTPLRAGKWGETHVSRQPGQTKKDSFACMNSFYSIHHRDIIIIVHFKGIIGRRDVDTSGQTKLNPFQSHVIKNDK